MSYVLWNWGLIKNIIQLQVDSFLLCAVLCADRVGQMTKTYSDIDAVTRLLEEVRS